MADTLSNRMVRLSQDEHLPFAGGSLDQPNFYIQAMELIRGLLNE